MNRFCVLGLGKFGTTLALTLAKSKKQVMIMDTDPSVINSLEKTFYHAVTVTQGWEAALRDTEIADYECVCVCIATNVNDNILVTIRLKELGIKKIIARATSEGHRKVLEKILDLDKGDEIIYPEQEMGEALAFRLAQKNVTEFSDFHGYQLATRPVPKKWIGKSIIELDVRKKDRINIIAVTDASSGTVSVNPDPTRQFIEGDKISVIANEDDMEKMLRKYS